MTRGSSSSSQVGLFSTQISEQIIRLRALTRHEDGPSEAHQVDLRRAVMATRLLAGSARILRLEVLQRFLDELLQWLQSVERGSRALNTTQALILESVVEMEEALMLHLDEVDDAGGADLGAFQPQIDDLLTLIRHNLSRTAKDDEPADTLDLTEIDRLSASAGPVNGPQALAGAVRWFGQAFAEAHDDEERAALLTALEGPLEQLIALRAESLQRSTDERSRELGASTEDLEAVDDPFDDPVIGRAATRLRDAASSLGVVAHVRVHGGGDRLGPGMQSSVAEILDQLVDDVIASLRAGRPEGDRSPVRVEFAVRIERGRARITIADDAPRLQGTPLLGDADHLALLGGLRRARLLLEQTQGLVRVDPPLQPDVRFELSVPLDRELPRYTLLDLERERVAVPAALVEDVIDASGLLYDTDETGESVEHEGRSVPIADLAQFVPTVVPASDVSPRIAILGSVEKRLGLGCVGEGEVVEARELSDPPVEWQTVAYAALDVDGTSVPVLDVRRLLSLRFHSEEEQLSGALTDALMDAYVPLDEEDEREFEPIVPETPAPDSEDDEEIEQMLVAPDATRAGVTAAPRPRRTLTRVLLVNQSEFRRRDLARTLEHLGFDVTVSGDLVDAADRIDADEIDLLVTDLRLGQERGQSLHALRERHPELRILLTSSVAQNYADELAEKTGAHRCWLDPYRASELREVLADLEAV